MRILIIEDNKELSYLMKQKLEQSGFTIDVANFGLDGKEKARINSYDVILLDLNLPDLDGIDVLRELRGNNITTSIIIISAREDFAQRALGLDSGADDYLTKPFDFSELVARIRAVVRRLYGRTIPTISIGNLMIEPNSRKAKFAEKELKLSSKEFDILEYLASRYPDVVSSEEITEHIYDEFFDPFSSVLRVHIANLRGKLVEIGGEGILQTSKGKGYYLCDK